MITIRFELHFCQYLVKGLLCQVHFSKLGSQYDSRNEHLVSVALKQAVLEIVPPKQGDRIDENLIMNFFDEILDQAVLLSYSGISVGPCSVPGSSSLLFR